MYIPPQLPENWKAITTLDFGNYRIDCEVKTESYPTAVHRANFINIQERWNTLWPKAECKIKEMLMAYGRPSDIKPPLYTMELVLAGEPIEKGVKWSSSAVIHDEYEGWWNCEFDGWDVDDVASQAYF